MCAVHHVMALNATKECDAVAVDVSVLYMLLLYLSVVVSAAYLY